MKKQPEDDPEAVPRVNLLDPTVEPTDAELEALMRAMIRRVRRKDAKFRRATREKLKAGICGTAQDADHEKPD